MIGDNALALLPWGTGVVSMPVMDKIQLIIALSKRPRYDFPSASIRYYASIEVAFECYLIDSASI